PSIANAGIVMSGRRPLIKGFFCGAAFDRGCGLVFGLLMRVSQPCGTSSILMTITLTRSINRWKEPRRIDKERAARRMPGTVNLGRSIRAEFAGDHNTLGTQLLPDQFAQKTRGGSFVLAAMDQDLKHSPS
ncbi:MAG: hypothetical protein WBG11_14655, partial [Methylocella sp.]